MSFTSCKNNLIVYTVHLDCDVSEAVSQLLFVVVVLDLMTFVCPDMSLKRVIFIWLPTLPSQ